MQPPKKRFMQTMEDGSTSAILVLDDDSSPNASARSGQSKNVTPSPTQRSPTTPQKPLPQQMQQYVDQQRNSRPSPAIRAELEAPDRSTIPHDMISQSHHSAFSRSGQITLNTVLANQQLQQHSVAAGHVIQGPPSVTLPATNAVRPQHRRSNSTETVAAYEMSQFYPHPHPHQHQHQQQQMYHIVPGGAMLPSASAAVSLSNGLPLPQVSAGLHNR